MTTALLLATHYHDGDHWFPWFPLIPLLFFGLWFLFFAVVIRPWRWRWRYDGPRSGESILAERFARGEIDEREYKARRASLRSKD
jgi:putative membrane protein